MAPTPTNTRPLLRVIVLSQGATSITDAMTEPRPRLTNTIGSVQQTSVVMDDAIVNTLAIRSFTRPLLSTTLSRRGGDARDIAGMCTGAARRPGHERRFTVNLEGPHRLPTLVAHQPTGESRRPSI